jgi:hypothetical protein
LKKEKVNTMTKIIFLEGDHEEIVRMTNAGGT